MKKSTKLILASSITIILYLGAFFVLRFLSANSDISFMPVFLKLVLYGVIGIGIGVLLQWFLNKFEQKKATYIAIVVGLIYAYFFSWLSISAVVVGMLIMEKPKKHKT
jgi:hypothetical protein